MRHFLILLLSILTFAFSQGQNIELSNSSFEGEPRDATVPQGWMPCKEGTTPDILPGYWGVYNEPSDGDTYVGLITRSNNTWETIGQRLPATLEKGTCYSWSFDLAHSDTYSGYNGPLKVRVWISDLKCQKDQMIYESPLIEHLDWETYHFKFTPKSDSRYILIEPFHNEGTISYEGNILIDRLRSIKGCSKA